MYSGYFDPNNSDFLPAEAAAPVGTGMSDPSSAEWIAVLAQRAHFAEQRAEEADHALKQSRYELELLKTVNATLQDSTDQKDIKISIQDREIDTLNSEIMQLKQEVLHLKKKLGDANKLAAKRTISSPRRPKAAASSSLAQRVSPLGLGKSSTTSSHPITSREVAFFEISPPPFNSSLSLSSLPSLDIKHGDYPSPTLRHRKRR